MERMDNIENYFDYAAATPILAEARKSMEPYLSRQFYNPSAIYISARNNRHDLENFRHIIAKGVGAQPTEIIFTAGGSEANNLAIKGILDKYPGSNVVTSQIEHESVLEPCNLYNHKLIKVDDKGIIDQKSLIAAINDKTVLVSIMYANNEIGSIQPIREISASIKEVNLERKNRSIKLPLYFHTDACQASNYLDMQVARLGVDLMTLNAGKTYGPKQCGALYIRKGINILPLILGGGQERKLRSGTENLANIAGFASAWETVRSDFRDESKRLGGLQDLFIKSTLKVIPAAIINGPNLTKRLPNNISLTIPSQDNERLVMQLDEYGFQVATGSACSAESSSASHVLRAIGLSEETAKSSLRISMGRFTTPEALKKLVLSLAKSIGIN